ncbi:hypothetical protein V6R21_11720 [Limibacter armeniacum]|uniref:hypothetical protein n=1 Tax=Limibacter armeniacum TaxID=466084 RepID=UPI002FE5E3D7
MATSSKTQAKTATKTTNAKEVAEKEAVVVEAKEQEVEETEEVDEMEETEQTREAVFKALTEDQKEQIELLAEKGITQLHFRLKGKKVEWFTSLEHAKQVAKRNFITISLEEE